MMTEYVYLYSDINTLSAVRPILGCKFLPCGAVRPTLGRNNNFIQTICFNEKTF